LSPRVQEKALAGFLEMRVDGVIVSRAFTLPHLLEPFSRAGVPVEPVEVSTTAPRDDTERLHCGSLAAFRHLLSLGHRNVALFVHERADAPARSPEMQARISALVQAGDEYGGSDIVIDLAPVSTESDVGPQLARLLQRSETPTALVGGNDWMTAPVLAATRDAGLRIPEDVSFLTYGDSRWAAAYRPAISVVRYDYYGEGQTLSARVLRRLGNRVDDALADQPLAVDEFIDRGSIARPRVRAQVARG
jgi:LacI family transcriptional regulator